MQTKQMSFNQPTRSLVRCAYSEESTWRSVFPLDPLHMFVTIGESLDARESFPAGSMKKSQGEVFQSYCFRE